MVLACLLRLDSEGFGRAAVGEGIPALMAANRRSESDGVKKA